MATEARRVTRFLILNHYLPNRDSNLLTAYLDSRRLGGYPISHRTVYPGHLTNVQQPHHLSRTEGPPIALIAPG